MQLIFSTLLSLCSGAEKLRSILSKSCGVYLCAIVKWLFLPFCAFWATFSLHNVALGLFVTLFGNEIARKRRPTVLTDYDSGIFSIKCYSRICFGKYIQVDYLPPCRADTGVPNGQKDAVGTGNALLVYQQGQDVWFWLGEENCGRKVGDIPDSHSPTLACGIIDSDPSGCCSGWKKERLTPEKSLQIGVGCRKPLFSPDA